MVALAIARPDEERDEGLGTQLLAKDLGKHLERMHRRPSHAIFKFIYPLTYFAPSVFFASSSRSSRTKSAALGGLVMRPMLNFTM